MENRKPSPPPSQMICEGGKVDHPMFKAYPKDEAELILNHYGGFEKLIKSMNFVPDRIAKLILGVLFGMFLIIPTMLYVWMPTVSPHLSFQICMTISVVLVVVFILWQTIKNTIRSIALERYRLADHDVMYPTIYSIMNKTITNEEVFEEFNKNKIELP